MFRNVCVHCFGNLRARNEFLYRNIKTLSTYGNSLSVASHLLKNGKGLSVLASEPQLCYSTNVITESFSNEESTIEKKQNIEDTDTAIEGPPETLLSSLSSDEQRKLQLLWMEIEVLYQSGNPVPGKMTATEWKEAMELPSRSQRQKFYRYLLIKENARKRDKLKKAKRQEIMKKEKQLKAESTDSSDNTQNYGLSKNTIFIMLRESSMNMMYNQWQCQGILFGQSIVVDLGYDDHMTKHEVKNCADQIRDMYAWNRMNRQPFNLHLCNAHHENKVLQYLESYIPNLYSHTCLITVTSNSYLDMFPKQQIVYLTPHCNEQLKNYDHDAVYIIGGIVDKSIAAPVSLAKAKKEGLAVARLPLDNYLEWGTSSGKSLTLDQMMKIMLDIKNTNDWNIALEHVPRRKLKKDDHLLKPPKPPSRYRRSLFSFDKE